MPRTVNQGTAIAGNLAVESVVLQLPGITVQAGSPVDLAGLVDVTEGTSGTAVTLRLRRGVDATGVLLATFGPFALAAAARSIFSVAWRDVQNVDVANQQYVVTMQQTAATGNGTANVANLRADY